MSAPLAERRAVSMTADELRAAQQTLALSDEALAAELALTPSVVRAWRTGA